MKKTTLNREMRKENIELYSMLLPLIAMLIIFAYIPMYGVVIAFQDYMPGAPFLAFDGSVKWVGLAHIKKFVSSIYFWRLIRNTLVLNFWTFVFGFWMPIVFALLLNEVRCMWYKKFVQTASYLPHFISSVVIAGLVISFVGKNGLVNQVLKLFGGRNRNLLTQARSFPFIYTFISVWQGFGFGSILYFSTIAGVDPQLYESARIDGANRLQQLWHITLPALRNLIAIQLIMRVGSILAANTDMILLLYNSGIYETSDVIGTYVYRLGIEGGQFSYTSAVGIFMSFFAFLMTFTANKISGKLTGYSLW